MVRMLQLETNVVALLHFDIVKNQYQCDSGVLCTFVSNKTYDQLLNISPANHIYSEKFKSKFSYIKVLFTEQNLEN